MTVLILSHPDDKHVDAVVPHLEAKQVPVVCVDTAQVGGLLPLVAHLGVQQPTVYLGDLPLSDVTCVWHRRPVQPQTPDPAGAAELRTALGGLLAGLPYLNHPADMAQASLKPYQLLVAEHVGLRIPETLISTQADPVELATPGDVVVKPMSRQLGGLLSVDDRSGWDRPVHMTQQIVNKVGDVRVTVVDCTMLAARIDSPHFDWRHDINGCHHEPILVPYAIQLRLTRLLAGLNLRFGAVDFAVDAEGRWWFLEINPNGQWLWIEHATGLPIAQTLASALTRTHQETG